MLGIPVAAWVGVAAAAGGLALTMVLIMVSDARAQREAEQSTPARIRARIRRNPKVRAIINAQPCWSCGRTVVRCISQRGRLIEVDASGIEHRLTCRRSRAA